MAYDPDRLVEQLGKRIAQLRLERGLSQGTFAAKLRTSPQWVSALERGTRSPTVHTLAKLANALDTTIESLFAKPSRRRLPPDETKPKRDA